MKVLHVITGISRSLGGPARSVQGLVAGLNRAGIEAWLLTLRHGDKPWVAGVDHFANGESFLDVVERIHPDIVHLHGLWSLALHRCAVICRKGHIPYVIAPRGMLEPWSLQQKWLKKRIARWLYQDRDLKWAAALHATSESEAGQFRRLGFKNRIIISPNGINVPSFYLAPKNTEDTRGTKRVLFVSRMHPKKGVMELGDAWERLADRDQWAEIRGWCCELVYTVNGDVEHEYEAKVKARVKELGLQDQFIFTGAMDDEEKWTAYVRADLFVLPTYSENFGIVVAEALWAGVPVITTKGTPWQEIQVRKCGWWIDNKVEHLVEAFRQAMSMNPQELCVMGERGRRLIKEKYTWVAVVNTMFKGYEEVFHGRT